MSKRVWNEGDPSKPYSVTFWGENPVKDEKLGAVDGNDTCWMGEDFATEKEARLVLADLDAHFPKSHRDIPYVLLDGPDVHEVTVRTKAVEEAERRRKQDDREARSEFAMQQGMGLGIHAYNEAMGYDSEPYDPTIHESYD